MSTLSSVGSLAPLQITGLASGLDTNSIIQELMAIARQPEIELQNEQTGLNAQSSQLTSIQTALQGLVLDAQALQDPGLFANTQTVTSTNSTLVGASLTSSTSGSGAVVGGYQISVTQLATAAQSTYAFTSPTSADTIQVGGQSYSLAAGASAQTLANEVNSDASGSAWATAYTGSGGNTFVVFSSRQTGSASSVSVTDTNGGTLALQSSVAGTDAQYSVNGGATQTSASNTVTTAIPGVTLTLSGLTGTPVTVNVSAPAPSTQNIQNALQSFVTAYNSVVDQVQTQLSQKTVSGDPTQGTLFGDGELTDLLGAMRSAIYTPGAGLPSGMASLFDIGVSTGATTGTASPSQNAISGHLTIDSSALASAIQSNPSGVQQVLQSFASSFSTLVNADAAAGGVLDSRIQGDASEVSSLQSRIDDLNASLAEKQAALQKRFARLEAAMSKSQSEGSWLTSQLNSLQTSFVSPTPAG